VCDCDLPGLTTRRTFTRFPCASKIGESSRRNEPSAVPYFPCNSSLAMMKAPPNPKASVNFKAKLKQNNFIKPPGSKHVSTYLEISHDRPRKYVVQSRASTSYKAFRAPHHTGTPKPDSEPKPSNNPKPNSNIPSHYSKQVGTHLEISHDGPRKCVVQSV